MKKRNVLRIGTGLALSGLVLLITASRSSRRSGNADANGTATYPPLNDPKPLADNVWIVDSGPIRPLGLTLPVRRTIVRLPGGELLLHSPTEYTAELARRVEQLGTVRHLIAPNIAHWTFLSGWQRACPDATLWAAPGLRDRAQVRQSGLRIDRDLGGEAPAQSAGTIAQGVVAGGRFAEVWFFHVPSRTMLLTDLIENLDPDKLPPVTGTLVRVARGTVGTTSLHVRAALKLDGKEAETAVRELVACAPLHVVFAHGDLFEAPAADRLQEGFAWLLGPAAGR
jgi:hypothetical protein